MQPPQRRGQVLSFQHSKGTSLSVFGLTDSAVNFDLRSAMTFSKLPGAVQRSTRFQETPSRRRHAARQQDGVNSEYLTRPGASIADLRNC